MSIGLRSQFFQAAGGPGAEAFPNPFLDIASTAIPHSLRNALYWAEYIYSYMGTYRTAMERIISYFLTDVEFGKASDEEKDKYGEFYDETLDFFTVAQNLLRDRMCYGNGFASFIVPFHRWLVCPKCGSSWPLRVVKENENPFKFEWSANLDFVASCPSCNTGGGYRGPMVVDDRDGDTERHLKIKHWSPHEIELLHDPYSDDVAYLWRIPEDYKNLVRQGHLFHLERVSKPVLEAIRKNYYFRFKQDAIFHMKEPTLAGLRNRGWGFPRILTNFRQIWYVQVLRRMNEAIALDYVIPLRIITPEPNGSTAATGGPLALFNGQDTRGQIYSMLRRRRRDPASWQVLPFPVRYTIAGGDANQLAPRDLLDQGYETLLNDAGTPVELYKGSLQLQTAPVALRLFESTWHHLVHDTNAFLRWTTRTTSQILGWEAVTAKMKRVTITDDVQKIMAALQLMIGQQLSGTTGMAMLGFDYKEEQKLKAEETRMNAELQARTQEEMGQAGFAQQLAKGQAQGQTGDPGQAQQPPQGAQPGMPMDPTGMGGGPVDQYVQSHGPNPQLTPTSMMQDADTLAQGLLGLPESLKDSQLRQLSQYNEALHALVRARMDKIRQGARSQGGAQMMGQ
jgi:hypothetical protein